MGSNASPLSSKKLEKPFQRKDIGYALVALFALLVFGVQFFYYKRKFNEICVAPTFVLGTFFLERLLLILQECILHRKRNKFNVHITIKLATQPSGFVRGDPTGFGFWIRLICFVFGATLVVLSTDTFFNANYIYVDVFVILSIIIIGINYQWYDCALLESYRLEKPFSYSGGSAMAFSFYYGYLKLIAPGLVSRINLFIYSEGISEEQIPHKKLFILIPSSSFVFDKLEGYQQCTKTKDLKIKHVAEKFECHEQDRGLVKRRTYKNTMYIVEYGENEKYYILLEGATPVKTFYETCKEHNEFEKHKNEVIFSFYSTLKILIRENKEMKDVVKLIYYDDENRNVTIPEIVDEKILKRKKKEN